MQTGTVKWFNHDKGYGFITPDDGGPDIFVHISAAKNAGLDLDENTRIGYDVIPGRSGKFAAQNLRAIS